VGISLLAAVAVAVVVVALVSSGHSSPPASKTASGGAAASKGGSNGGAKGAPAAGSASGATTAASESGQPGTYTTFNTPDGVGASWVVAENRKPGSTGWQLTGTQTTGQIEGFANAAQATVGQTVALYVSSQAPTFHVEAYRMGYYGGAGGRLIWQSSELPGHVQAACPVTPGINMVSCTWSPSLTFVVTPAWVQGEYLLKLVGSGGQQNYIQFTIWDPASHATYVIMSGVLTDQAFNPFGGYDLYQGATACAPDVYPCSARSLVVSFDRPYANGNGAGSFLPLIYPLTRFAEEQGLDATYWTDITLSTYGNLLVNHKVLISPGHDEEWSLEMRQAATAAADRGVNLIFFGASPVLRKVRLQPSPIGADDEMVNYRDPQADPLYGVDNAEVSQNWWGQPPANLPDNALIGATYIGYYNSGTFPLVVTNPTSWLFAGTGLVANDQIPRVFAGDFQAYEPSAGDNPPGVEILSHSPVTVSGHPELHYADTSYYTMPVSHAGVFSSGTVNWIPSLQDCPTATDCPGATMQKITGNLLRVFGAGPVGLTYPSVANWQNYY
jgi:hypothetical protein